MGSMDKNDYAILIRVETKVDTLTEEVKKINDKVSNKLFKWIVSIIIAVLLGISGRQMVQATQSNINKTNIEHLTNEIADYKMNK